MATIYLKPNFVKLRDDAIKAEKVARDLEAEAESDPKKAAAAEKARKASDELAKYATLQLSREVAPHTISSFVRQGSPWTDHPPQGSEQAGVTPSDVDSKLASYQLRMDQLPDQFIAAFYRASGGKETELSRDEAIQAIEQAASTVTFS